MSDLFVFKFKHSESHLVFPRIVLWIIGILFVILVIQRFLRCRREGTPFINFKGYHFFVPKYDKLKFWGSLLLLFGYIYCLTPMGFLWASLLFVFLFNVLFAEPIKWKVVFGKEQGVAVDWKNLAMSAAISIVFSTFIWWLFGVAFNITLP